MFQKLHEPPPLFYLHLFPIQIWATLTIKIVINVMVDRVRLTDSSEEH